VLAPSLGGRIETVRAPGCSQEPAAPITPFLDGQRLEPETIASWVSPLKWFAPPVCTENQILQ
jgi:hypothetical protein